MAKLGQFRSDTKAISDGQWVRLGAQFDDLEILSRGFTDDFLDARTRLTSAAAMKYGGNPESVPNAEMRQINAQLLRDYLILDVRNLTDDVGEPTPIEQFHVMLADPEYQRLSVASWEAARRVTSQTTAQADAARKNSLQPPALHSNGGTSGHA